MDLIWSRRSRRSTGRSASSASRSASTRTTTPGPRVSAFLLSQTQPSSRSPLFLQSSPQPPKDLSVYSQTRPPHHRRARLSQSNRPYAQDDVHSLEPPGPAWGVPEENNLGFRHQARTDRPRPSVRYADVSLAACEIEDRIAFPFVLRAWAGRLRSGG